MAVIRHHANLTPSQYLIINHPVPKVFQRIALIAKPEADGLSEVLSGLSAYLKQKGLEVLAGPNAARVLKIKPHDLSDLGSQCDLALVIGGDGTLLSTARRLANTGIPMVGINLGRLGFLADISPAVMKESLDAILAGDYQQDERYLLEATVGDQPPVLAFNDVVLHKWNMARMIEFETRIDGRLVHRQRSDGIIISTPTGSTAYALSGGGPLLTPGLDAMALVPICPHTLSNRPIVVGGQSEIEIQVCGRTDFKHVRITCDGQTNLELNEGDWLHVKKYSHPVHLIHPSDHDHFELLRVKLNWGGQPS